MAKIAYYADAIGEHRSITPEGFLLARDIPISRTGWQSYLAAELQRGEGTLPEIAKLNSNATVNVYRDPGDVFDPAALASFEGKSVTRNHPSGLLTAQNDRDHAIGHIQNVRKGDRLPDGEYSVIADILFKDQQAIQYLVNGAGSELSCGYTYKLVPMDDEHSPYTTYRMTEIRGNHVALVSSGRAGQYVRVLDAKPEEGSNAMEFKDFTEFFKTMGLRLAPAALDAESETVETQKKKDAEALQLKERTMDAEEKKAMDKRMKDSEEKIEEVGKKAAETKEAVDALAKTIKDGFEEMKAKKAEDGKCTCDAKEGEEHSKDCAMADKGAKDSDLIPTKTLSGEEIPKNPIPGADRMVATLRKLRPIIADAYNAGALDDDAVDTFNRVFKAAKGGKQANDADYAKVLAAASTVDKKAVENANGGHVVSANDEAMKPGAYQDMMKKFSRKNPSEWVQ